MMRLLIIFGCLPLAACSAEMSKSEQLRHIDELEGKVALPEGGGKLECYRRDYAVTDSDDGEAMLGFYTRADSFADPRLQLPSVKPGVYLHQPGFKIGVMDQGCNKLFVRYEFKSPEARPQAICFPDISGVHPQRVVPSVEC